MSWRKWSAALGVRVYRHERQGGADRDEALDAAVQASLPGPVAFLVRNQVQLLSSLVLLARRRRHGVPPGAVALGYDRAVRPLAVVMLVLSVVELAVIELAVPWPTVRLVLLVLGAYALLFVLGMTAANTVRPHVLTADQLRLRSGSWADVRVPVHRVATALAQTRHAPSSVVSVTGDELVMGVAGTTNVEVRLVGPTPISTGRGSRDVSTVRFAVDDPRAAVRELVRRQARAVTD